MKNNFYSTLVVFWVFMIFLSNSCSNATEKQKDNNMELSISEQLCYCTVRIEAEFKNGSKGTGTGFFFKFLEDVNSHVPVIVTNKHMVADSVTGLFRLTLKDANGKPINASHQIIKLDNFEKHWIFHPDPSVDLAVMPIATLLQAAESQGKSFFYKTFNKDIVVDVATISELSAIEEIIMIGYPVGIWDSANNMPIVRKGITATRPDLDYEGRKEFMIDAACFPGSSGSPVLLFNLGGYTTKTGNTRLGGARIKLLGVLYAGPQFTVEGKLEIIPIPTKAALIAVSQIPTNLGLVIKAERILEFERVLEEVSKEKNKEKTEE